MFLQEYTYFDFSKLVFFLLLFLVKTFMYVPFFLSFQTGSGRGSGESLEIGWHCPVCG